MPLTLHKDTFQTTIRDIWRDLDDLQNTNPLLHGSVGADGYFAQYDSNGIPRIEFGNLAARGSSPAQIGIRVNDSGGNPIFDSTGLFGDRVMKSLGIANGNVNQSFTSTTFAQVAGSSLNFTIPAGPPTNLYCPFVGTGNVSTNNGNVGFLRANLVGVTTSGNENFGVLANFAQTSSGWIFVTNIAAGSYSIELDAAVNNTPQTFLLIQSAVQVFKLGGG